MCVFGYTHELPSLGGHSIDCSAFRDAVWFTMFLLLVHTIIAEGIGLTWLQESVKSRKQILYNLLISEAPLHRILLLIQQNRKSFFNIEVSILPNLIH